MIKKYSALLSLFLIASSVFALEIKKDEMVSSQNSTIEFINYEGPHKIIDSVKTIRGIGEKLGIQISRDVSKNSQTELSEKYYVIHAIDEKETSKLDADILYLNENAGVDHVKNLRRILSGYILTAYGYSQEDADTLAVFITVYNAVYRGNLDYFTEKYKSVVLEKLSSENCGLSVNYEDWPGKTEIVIPLYDVNNGGLSILDTSIISDDEVVSSMQNDDDKNIENRKDLVDLKERESDEAYEKAQQAQKDAADQQKQLESLEKEKSETEDELHDAEYKAAENPDNESLKKDVEDKKKELEEQNQKEKDLQQSIKDSKEEAEKQQELSDKKDYESQNERKEIAKDQAIVQNEEAENAKVASGYGLIVCDETTLFSQLVKYNKENGNIIKNSPVKLIRNRIVYKTSDKYIAIAGENPTEKNPNRDIRIILLDPNTLEIFSQSQESIYENSVFVKDNDNYYAIIYSEDLYILGKYDENLNILAKSQIEVYKDSPVTINEDIISVTDTNGKLQLLDKTNLKVILSN